METTYIVSILNTKQSDRVKANDKVRWSFTFCLLKQFIPIFSKLGKYMFKRKAFVYCHCFCGIIFSFCLSSQHFCNWFRFITLSSSKSKINKTVLLIDFYRKCHSILGILRLSLLNFFRYLGPCFSSKLEKRICPFVTPFKKYDFVYQSITDKSMVLTFPKLHLSKWKKCHANAAIVARCRVQSSTYHMSSS